MMKHTAPLVLAVLLVLSVGAEAGNDTGDRPTGFSNATESAGSKGETGGAADCPIKKTVDGKTVCFQNDPALANAQGGK